MPGEMAPIRPPRRFAQPFRFPLPLFLALAARGAAPVPVTDAFIPAAPPPAPPILIRALTPDAGSPGLAGDAPYSIGEPTDEEQLYVEFINRARMDPGAEVARYIGTTDPDILNAYRAFSVDLARLAADFAAIAPAPPVSIHPQLTDAARLHSTDMFQNEFQGHTGTDGSSLTDRLNRVGYAFQTAGENVYSTSKNPWFGHVGFDVDWGPGPGGVQNPPGHRITIHNGAFREVGVGVVLGKKGTVGPEVVTQEFATRQNSPAFITGVVYFDLNGNSFYDLGEGVGGVTVRADGLSTRAVTARSGGYSLPVNANGTYPLTFQVPGLADVTRSVTVSGLANAKADHVPPYSPPVLGGASLATVNASNPYVISPVPAATAYDWRSLVRTPWGAADGAEAGLVRFSAEVSAGYNPVATDVRRSGTASYRFAHPAPPATQYLHLRDPLLLGKAAELNFWSRLAVATSNQVARVQVSNDGGLSWATLWSQSGSGSPGEATFRQRSVSLAAYAGQSIALRFAFAFVGGSYFPQTTTGIGWYLDDIVVSDAESLGNESVQVAGGGSFAFRPSAEGLYLLQARARIGDRQLNWGPGLAVTAQAGVVTPPVLRLGTPASRPAGGWILPFQLEQGTAGVFEVETASAITGPWGRDASAVIEPTGTPGGYQATLTTAAGASGFLRVLAR